MPDYPTAPDASVPGTGGRRQQGFENSAFAAGMASEAMGMSGAGLTRREMRDRERAVLYGDEPAAPSVPPAVAVAPSASRTLPAVTQAPAVEPSAAEGYAALLNSLALPVPDAAPPVSAEAFIALQHAEVEAPEAPLAAPAPSYSPALSTQAAGVSRRALREAAIDAETAPGSLYGTPPAAALPLAPAPVVPAAVVAPRVELSQMVAPEADVSPVVLTPPEPLAVAPSAPVVPVAPAPIDAAVPVEAIAPVVPVLPLAPAPLSRRAARAAAADAGQSVAETAPAEAPMAATRPIEPVVLTPAPLRPAATPAVPAVPTAPAAKPELAAPSLTPAPIATPAYTQSAVSDLFNFATPATGEVEAPLQPSAEFAAPAFAAPAPRRSAPETKAEFEPAVTLRPAPPAPKVPLGRRIATKASVFAAMGFVALMAVATSVPADALLTADDVKAAALAAQQPRVEEPGQTMSASGVESITVQADNFDSATVAETAAASGIRMESTFVNNPNGTVQWPFLVGVHVGDRFGYRDCAGCSSNHGGQDFNPGDGAQIQSIADGVVSVAVDGEGSLGVHMMIDHVIDGRTVTSVYAHMQHGTMQFNVGDTVKVGQYIGNTGNTGQSTGPHLHFEIRIGGVGGTKVDPLDWLYANTN